MDPYRTILDSDDDKEFDNILELNSLIEELNDTTKYFSSEQIQANILKFMTLRHDLIEVIDS